MPKINWSEIRTCIDRQAFEQKMQEILASSMPDDPVLISDCLANMHGGGGTVIKYLSQKDNENLLRNLPRYQYTIEVLFDEWGNVPNPGDMVVRTHKQPLQYERGKPIPGSELSMMIRDGSYDENLLFHTEFIVDKKGCITCGLHDAIHFLNLWGIHCNTNKPLTSKKPTSTEPVLRGDGQRLHVHYHRYKEADKHRYSHLPKREKTNKRCEENTL